MSVTLHCTLSLIGYCLGHGVQSQFTYSDDVVEHTYDEVERSAIRELPSPPWRRGLELPQLQSRYSTPRRLYYNQSPDAYEVVDQFVDPSTDYQALQDHTPLDAQPPDTTAPERPVPKPRQRGATYPRVDPPAAVPPHPAQSMDPSTTPYTVMHPEDVVRQQVADAAAGRLQDDGVDDDLPAPLTAVVNTSVTASVGSTGNQTGGYVSISQQQLSAPSEMVHLQGDRRSAHSNDLGQQKMDRPVESYYSDQLFEGSPRPMQMLKPGGPSGTSSRGASASPKHRSPEPMGSGAQSYATAGPSSSKADAQVSCSCAWLYI